MKAGIKARISPFKSERGHNPAGISSPSPFSRWRWRRWGIYILRMRSLIMMIIIVITRWERCSRQTLGICSSASSSSFQEWPSVIFRAAIRTIWATTHSVSLLITTRWEKPLKTLTQNENLNLLTFLLWDNFEHANQHFPPQIWRKRQFVPTLTPSKWRLLEETSEMWNETICQRSDRQLGKAGKKITISNSGNNVPVLFTNSGKYLKLAKFCPKQQFGRVSDEMSLVVNWLQK